MAVFAGCVCRRSSPTTSAPWWLCLQGAPAAEARLLLQVSGAPEELRAVVRVQLRPRVGRLPVRVLLPVLVHATAELPRPDRATQPAARPARTTLSQRGTTTSCHLARHPASSRDILITRAASPANSRDIPLNHTKLC